MKHSVVFTELEKESLTNVEEIIHKHHGKLSEYVSQLRWWNKKVNLISRDVSHETLMEHVAHSLLLSQLSVFQNASKIIDTGTGGGLPGLPLALCFQEKEFILNDIVSKKMMVVKQMALKLKAGNVQTDARSIGDISLNGELIITKHAFKVYELLAFLEGKNRGDILFLKGEKEAKEEIEQIDIPITATIINLDRVLSSEFYKGKAIVHISGNNE